MRHIKNIIIFCIILVGLYAGAQQYEYLAYEVQEGETIDSISSRNNAPIKMIRKLNLDVNLDSLSFGVQLIIPRKIPKSSYVKHKIEPSQTLYRLSKIYSTTIKKIEAINPGINIYDLAIGETIKVPVKNVEIDSVYSSEEIQKKLDFSPIKDQEYYNNLPYYIAKKGDTPYSIAKNQGFKLRQLRKNNPFLKDGLKIGDTIFFEEDGRELLKAKKMFQKSNQHQRLENYRLHKVKKKEGLYAISRFYGVTINDIYEINPGLREEVLKAGATIRIPPLKTREDKSDIYLEEEDIEDEIATDMPPFKGFTTYMSKPVFKFSEEVKKDKDINVALVLPLNLRRYKYKTDSLELIEKLKKDKLTNLTLDFFMGASVAIDSLKQKGAQIKMKVFDSEADDFVVSSLIAEGSFNEVDLVIGPLYPKTFNILSQYLEYLEIPIISPLTKKGVVNRVNTITSIPSDESLQGLISDYVKEIESDAKLFYITENENLEKITYLQNKFPSITRLPMINSQLSINVDTLYSFFSYKLKPHKLQEKDALGKSPEMINLMKDSILNMKDSLSRIIDTMGLKNVVFVETNNKATVSSVTSVLNSFVSDTCSIKMVTTNKSSAYDDVNVLNNHLSNLNFHYPSFNKPLTHLTSPYVINFKEVYDIYPSRYAIRGFDLTYDILSRVLEDDNWRNQMDYRTRHVENIFDYEQTPEGGYINRGIFIIQYKNMMLEEVTE